MGDNAVSIPGPVEGVVIGRSLIKSFIFSIVFALLFLLGVGLVWAKVTDQVILLDKKVTWWGLLIGIGAVIVGPVFIVLTLRAIWVRRRIIIGADRLQLIERRQGQDVVIVQIPYQNIVELKCVSVSSSQWQIGITLKRLDDPETFAKSENFEHNEKLGRRHYVIGGGYRKNLTTIAKMLNESIASVKK
jgi:hypothetical protein